MRSKFHREQRTRIVFQKEKIKTKLTNFRETLLAWEQRESMEQVEQWNENFVKPLMEAQKEDAKEHERSRSFLFLFRDVWRTQLKAVPYLLEKVPS